MRRLLNVRVLLLLGCLGLSAAVYFSEWVEVTRNGGYSADAIRNRYLAAEQFLGRFGIEVELSDGLRLLDALPSTSHTLLIASSRRALSERRTERLMSWVEDGGRLVLVASDYWDASEAKSGDKLLDALGVRLHRFRGDLDGTDSTLGQLIDELTGGLVNQADCGTGAQLARIGLAGEQQEITATFTTSSFLALDGDRHYAFAENAAGPQLLFVEVGDGAVVVLTNLSMWNNRQIHCHDHAHLLRWLTEDRPVLWWLFNTEMDALPVLIFERYPVLVGLLFSLIVLWVWRVGKRLQRLPAAPDPARRELIEHIDGVARYYWQQRASARLLEPLRRAVLRGTEPSPARIASLASRTGLTQERVRWALTHAPDGDARSFLAAAKILYDLNKLNA